VDAQERNQWTHTRASFTHFMRQDASYGWAQKRPDQPRDDEITTSRTRGAMVAAESRRRRRAFLGRERRTPGLSCAGIHDHRRTVHLPEVEAHITGTVWKIEVEVGDSVEEGDTVVILESMKMEMPVEAEDPGVVSEILCEEGQSVSEGDTLVVLE